MIARSESSFSLPEVRLGLVSSPAKLVDRYRALSTSAASVTAATVSFGLATVSGFLGGAAAMYLYDRAESKGDDAAIGLGGLFAVGTFTFIFAFTWLQKAHHPVSSRTSLYAFYASLVLPALTTLLSADEMDYYATFILGDWLAILVLGLLALLVCRRWWQHEEEGF
jgi:hypothetical protein